MRKIPILILLFLVSVPANSQETKRHEAWTFYMDNDLLSHETCQATDLCSENQDRSYTGGFGIGFKINPYYKGAFTDSMRALHDWLDGNHEKINGVVQYENYGLTAFTPNLEDQVDEDLDGTVDPLVGDRPFASMWFYTSILGVDVTRDRERENARRTQITLSLLGTDVGYDLQQFIHCDLDSGRCPVEGWENNINDGYDIAATFGKSYIYLLHTSQNGRHEWIFDQGFNIGLYTELNVGISYRFGTIVSPYYSFDSDPFSNVNKIVFDASSVISDHYFWTSLRAHYVLYNGLLQGWHLFSDEGPLVYNSDEIENALLSMSVGYTFPVPFTDSSSLTFKVQGRSAEIDDDRSEDHAWGGLYWTSLID